MSVAEVTWLVTGFYVAAAVGQPLMGRLIDQFGARRLFLGGLVVVLVSSALTPFVPGLWWLVALRVVQAFGTSTAYPAALVLIRSGTAATATPASALGAITIANSACAALGPVLGGFLVVGAGWQAVFLVNVPLTLIGLVLAGPILPHTRETPTGRTTPDRPAPDPPEPDPSAGDRPGTGPHSTGPRGPRAKTQSPTCTQPPTLPERMDPSETS